MNNKIIEGEKYLKRVLKGKMSVTEGLSVSFKFRFGSWVDTSESKIE